MTHRTWILFNIMAVSAAALIVIHAGIMLGRLGPYIEYVHPKMVSGYTAILLLSITVAAGYVRTRRASGFRRKLHLTTAFLFAALFLTPSVHSLSLHCSNPSAPT